MRSFPILSGIAPVLVDVGASLGPPDVWAPIAASSTYVGFDPDRRETGEAPSRGYRRAYVVAKAVTPDPEAREARFYLTRSPPCSSTLPPDAAALAEHHFAPLFEVEREASVPAATLDAVVAELGLPGIDWLKLDTQGTDLRLYASLGERLRGGLLALDVEPGLIDAYRGEDLFAETHQRLARDGFWLSRLDVNGAARVRLSSLRAAFPGEADPGALAERGIRRSPGWCEARYLRTLGALAAAGAPPERYELLALFALLDGQPGYALDVALERERRFGASEAAARLRADAEWRIRHPRRASLAERARGWLRRLRA